MIEAILYSSCFLILFLYIYLVLKNSNNNLLVIGAIFGLIYFNILPFLVFLLNDGSEGLIIDSTSKWAIYNHILENHFNNLYYFISLLIMVFSIHIYSVIFKQKQIGQEKDSNISTIGTSTIGIIFILLLFFKESLIPEDITHWAKRAEYFNEHYGFFANIYSFILIGIKYLILVLSHNLFRSNFNFAVLFLLMIAILDTLITSNRIFFLVCGIVIFYNMIVFKKYKFLIIGFIFSIPLIFLMSIWPYVRAISSEMSLIDALVKGINNFELSTNIFNYIIFSATEGADFLVSYTMLIDIPNNNDYLYGSTIFKIFTYFIPRSIWEDKWESIALVAAQRYDNNLEGFSLNTTFLGEAYANFGLVGIFVFTLFILIVLHYMNLFLNRLKFIKLNLDILFFAIIFQTMRANFSDIFLIVINLTILLMLYSLIKSFLKKFNNRRKEGEKTLITT